MKVKGHIEAATASIGGLPHALREFYVEKTGADQAITTGAGDTAIVFASPDTGNGFLFPGADGVVDYLVTFNIHAVYGGGAGIPIFHIQVGAAGTTADAEVMQASHRFASSGEHLVNITVKVSNPSATDVVSISVEAIAQTITISGATTAPTTQFCTMTIKEYRGA